MNCDCSFLQNVRDAGGWFLAVTVTSYRTCEVGSYCDCSFLQNVRQRCRRLYVNCDCSFLQNVRQRCRRLVPSCDCNFLQNVRDAGGCM